MKDCRLPPTASRIGSGRGNGAVRMVVLADTEHIQADLIGKLDLFDEIAQPLRGRRRHARRHCSNVVDTNVDRYVD